MMTICGNPRAREGNIYFAGRDITALPTHEIAKLRIAQSPEGRRIFPRMTVMENLQIGATVTGAADLDGDLDRVFTLFPRLRDRRYQRGGTLSGGEQQMLAIGRALMARPRLILLDEPSLGLAPLLVQQIFAAIRALNERDKLTVFLVEQNAHHALKLAHRGYVMVNGVIAIRAAVESCCSGRKYARLISKAASLKEPAWIRCTPIKIDTDRAGDARSRRRRGVAVGPRHCARLATPWQVVVAAFCSGPPCALSFCVVPRQVAVAGSYAATPILSHRRHDRLAGDMGVPDGAAISLALRPHRPAELARNRATNRPIAVVYFTYASLCRPTDDLDKGTRQ